MPPKNKLEPHEYGIDLLRLIAMFMITVLHCVNQFSSLLKSNTLLEGKILAYALESICYCGVDCFALISGYLLIYSQVKLAKLFNLWFTCIFYSIG